MFLGDLLAFGLGHVGVGLSGDLEESGGENGDVLALLLFAANEFALGGSGFAAGSELNTEMRGDLRERRMIGWLSAVGSLSGRLPGGQEVLVEAESVAGEVEGEFGDLALITPALGDSDPVELTEEVGELLIILAPCEGLDELGVVHVVGEDGLLRLELYGGVNGGLSGGLSGGLNLWLESGLSLLDDGLRVYLRLRGGGVG